MWYRCTTIMDFCCYSIYQAMKIAIFGSAFNPPTLGHCDAINYVLEQGYEQVWLVPSFQHAFGKQMLCYEARLNLLNAFQEDLANPAVKVCAVEQHIARDEQPVYTWDVLNHLQQTHPESEFAFVIGPDNQVNWHKFYKADEITQRWQVIAVPERQAIRSTLVRQAINENRPIAQLVTPSVANLIITKKHYRPNASH